MNSVGQAAPRRRPWRSAALALGLALLGLSLLLALYQAPPGPGLLLLAVLAGAVLMLMVAGLAWHLSVRLARTQFGEALREARQQAHQLGQLLGQLQGEWQWLSDAQHHLVRWQPPQGGPASAWAGSSVTETLWQRFQPLEAHLDLRQLLDAHQPLKSLAVRDAQGRAWMLRALPNLDRGGRFAGYLGLAQPLQAARADWLQALPGPAWLLSEALPGPQTRLLDANDAARQMMGALPESLNGQAPLWRACQDRLPLELREALAQPQIESGTACGAWWLCLTELPANATAASPTQGGALLSLWPQGAADTVPAALAMQAAEQARADQASFSYTVSHDLRAPLRVVEGFTRILKEDYGRLLDRVGNDHLERVLGASARMHSMIDSLLALSQLSAQPLQQECVDLSALAQQVLEELRRAAPDRPADCHVQPGLNVRGDATLLRMVLENLLGNAWKYSGKCERVQIRFEALEDAARGERVFVVSDRGAGFDMRFAERLFGVFQRLHSASDFQGTGVGLASARRIVRRHGGDIWAESEVGQGARFYFTLPGV
jgi:signal transduction histidine kinase